MKRNIKPPKGEPLQKYAAYVVTIVKVSRVLARSGKEASKLAADRVRKLLAKEDTHPYIPTCTVVKGGLNDAVLEDLKRGVLPGLEGESLSRRVIEPGEVEKKCRNCGHTESQHHVEGTGCAGNSGIVCGCIGWEEVIKGIDEEIKQGDKTPEDIGNERRREREKKTEKGERKIRWGREVENFKEEGDEDERFNNHYGSNVYGIGDGKLGSGEHGVANEKGNKDISTRPRCKEHWDTVPTRSEHSWDTGTGECRNCGETMGEYTERRKEHMKGMLEKFREERG